MNAALDTNVLVSAAINPRNPPAQIVRAWQSEAFVLVTSAVLIGELRLVLARRVVRRYLTWNADQINEVFRRLSVSARIVEPARRLRVLADEADNRVLEAAVEAQAGYIVTGDRELLTLGEYEGIEIVKPVRFAAILASAAS
jgi:putative PIN family toxin of toxin-antitoxin system